MSANPRKITLGFSLLILILLIVIGVWHAGYFGNPQTKNSPTPLVKVFSEKDQFIPQGAASLDVNRSLSTFGFPKPLPFFDKNNVVQSYGQADSIASSSVISLNYRIFRHNRVEIRNVLSAYFKELGWQIESMPDHGDQTLKFSLRQTRQLIFIGLVDEPHTMGAEESVIIVGLSMVTFPPSR